MSLQSTLSSRHGKPHDVHGRTLTSLVCFMHLQCSATVIRCLQLWVFPFTRKAHAAAFLVVLGFVVGYSQVPRPALIVDDDGEAEPRP